MNNLNQLLLHQRTKEQLAEFTKAPKHALLLIGAVGSGKTSVAQAMAAQLLSQDKDISSYPYYFRLAKEDAKQEIPIAQVREVIAKLQLKAPGSKQIRKIIFIEDAHFLSIPAQNAILKILEEPSEDSVFLLTASSTESILPTIASRAYKIAIRPVELKSAQAFWADSFPASAIEKAWNLSDGTPGLLSSLLTSDKTHQLTLAIEDVKVFLKLDRYQRLLMLEKINLKKQQLEYFLEGLSRTLKAVHKNAINKNSYSQANKTLVSRKTVIEAQNALNHNVSARLVTLQLIENLQV